jgi:hypothetical protein
MISERQALAGTPPSRDLPPPDVPITHDTGVDQTRLAELARFEANRRDRHPVPPADPLTLAREFLTRAHFAASDLDAVAPLIHAASAQGALEKQLVAPGAGRPAAP